MHSPKSIEIRPLRYDTHLCNNLTTVTQHLTTLQRGLDRFVTFVEDMSNLANANARSMRQLISAVNLEDFSSVHTVWNAVEQSLAAFTSNCARHEDYARQLDEYLRTNLKPARTKLAAHGRKTQADLQLLERRKVELIDGVNRAKARYWKAGQRAAEIDAQISGLTPERAAKERTKAQQPALREMKDAAAGYVEAVERLMTFLPQYNEEGAQTLQAFEAADRCVLSAVEQSLAHWAAEYERMARGLSEDTVQLQQAVTSIDVSLDVDRFVLNHRLDPTPDPAQVYKFQLFETTTSGGGGSGSPKDKRRSNTFYSGVLSLFSDRKEDSTSPIPTDRDGATSPTQGPTSPALAAAEGDGDFQRVLNLNLADLPAPCVPPPLPATVPPSATAKDELDDEFVWVKPDSCEQKLKGHAGRLDLACAIESVSGTYPEPAFTALRDFVAKALDEANEAGDTQAAIALVHACAPICMAKDPALESPRAPLTLATALKDHPFLLDLNVWEHWMWVTLTAETDEPPSRLTAERWRSTISHIQNPGANTQLPPFTAIEPRLPGLVAQLLRLGADQRLQKRLVSRLAEALQLTNEQRRQVEAAFPHITWLATQQSA